MNIKKGDNVIILAGKDKGKHGKVAKAIPSLGRVVVEGVNMFKKHQKPRSNGGKGTTLDINGSINVSNVMLLDPKGGKQTRIGKKKVGDKTVRIAKKSGQEI